MLRPARRFVFENQTPRRSASGGDRGEGVEVEVDNRIGHEPQREHGEDEDGEGEGDLGHARGDPRRPAQTLEAVLVATGGALPVVAFLQGVLHAPGGEAFLVHVLLAAFAFAGAEQAAAVVGWGFVGHAGGGLEGGGEGGGDSGVGVEGGEHAFEADAALAGGVVAALAGLFGGGWGLGLRAGISSELFVCFGFGVFVGVHFDPSAG